MLSFHIEHFNGSAGAEIYNCSECSVQFKQTSIVALQHQAMAKADTKVKKTVSAPCMPWKIKWNCTGFERPQLNSSQPHPQTDIWAELNNWTFKLNFWTELSVHTHLGACWPCELAELQFLEWNSLDFVAVCKVSPLHPTPAPLLLETTPNPSLANFWYTNDNSW